MSSADGSAVAAGAVNIFAGGLLRLDDSGGVNSAGRLGAGVAVNMKGGTFELVGNNSAMTFGTLTFLSAPASINVSGSGNNAVTFSTINLGSAGAILDLSSVSDLGGANKVLLTNNSGLLASNGMVSRVVVGNNFATYDALKGLTAFTGYATGELDSLSATATALVTGPAALSSSRSINALKMASATVGEPARQ